MQLARLVPAVAVVLLSVAPGAMAQPGLVIKSVDSWYWQETSTWNLGIVPGPNDFVTVKDSVTLDVLGSWDNSAYQLTCQGGGGELIQSWEEVSLGIGDGGLQIQNGALFDHRKGWVSVIGGDVTITGTGSRYLMTGGNLLNETASR